LAGPVAKGCIIPKEGDTCTGQIQITLHPRFKAALAQLRTELVPRVAKPKRIQNFKPDIFHWTTHKIIFPSNLPAKNEMVSAVKK